MMHLNKVSTIDATPIAVSDLKTQSVINHSADDTLLAELISDAIEQVESDTGRVMIETTFTLTGKCFPAVIHLPKPPFVAVDSIKYVDTDGVLQTLSSALYQDISSQSVAMIKPAPGQSWPAVQSDNENAVIVQFRSGYVQDDGEGGTTGEMPRRARRAVLIWAAHLYENREHMSPVQLQELPSYWAALSTLEANLI